MQSQNLMQQSNEVEVLFPELHEEDLNSVVGGFGWDDIKKGYRKFEGGVKRAGQGIKDGSRDGNSRHDDLWYNLGYGGGKFLDS